MRRLLIALVFAAAGMGGAEAQVRATLGQPVYGGSGCPQGTASATLSGDGSTLSILYDQYIAEAGVNGRSFDRKSCNLAIPLNVPGGFSVSLVGIDYRGFNLLPAGGRSTFRVEYFFAGGQGPVFTRNFTGPTNDDFLIHNDIDVAGNVWSPCGASVNVRTNSSIRVTSAGNRQAMVTVDSEDIDAAVVFQLEWRRC